MKRVTFERHTAERLIRNSRYIDQKPRNEVKDPSPPRGYDGLTVMVLTEPLPAGSVLTPGKGMGKIQKFDGTVYSDAGPATYPIINIHSNKIASGAVVLCGPACGYFHLITTGCVNVS